MSRLNDIIRQVAKVDSQLAKDLQRETDALADRRAFGLNFERHVPEVVELPGRPVRKNDKVRVLPERGQLPSKENEKLYRVTGLVEEEDILWANVEAIEADEEPFATPVDELVVVAEFRDPIYPGLVSSGRVERGCDKPFHCVINAENFHALQALLFTHRGKIDAIYIDPPYNTGARDWKYNNDYVEADDHYRHSKWLAFVERRLLLAKELLNPEDSVLIVTIDEKEYLRLGLLLEQTFPAARIQMVSSVINRKGVIRANELTRTNEFIYFVTFGRFRFHAERGEDTKKKVRWASLRRMDIESKRGTAKGGQSQFFPIYISKAEARIVDIGDPIAPDVRRDSVPERAGCITLWPLRPDGTEMNWGLTPETVRKRWEAGFVKVVPGRSGKNPTLYYLTSGQVADIRSGELVVSGRDSDGSVVVEYVNGKMTLPTTQWDRESHSAQTHGTGLLAALLPGRKFPFPKSLYAVEDVLRLAVGGNQNALVVDFFAGSGTTAHALMRLNRQDGGKRMSISVTNNEVSADEQRALRDRELRPGDSQWESWGIFEHIARPRLKAAVVGKSPNGRKVVGEYRFTDEFPMSDGFQENVEFFSLTYESGMRVASNREFPRIAPLLWLRAGSRGRRIDAIPDGWDVAETYGVIADLDQSDVFVTTLEAQEALTHAFVITDEDRLFEAMVRRLPEHIEPVRLYSSYMRTFEIEAGRANR